MKAIPILRENLHQIHTVAEWAHIMGYSRAHFSILIKREYDLTPSKIMRHEKHRKVEELVRNNPGRKGTAIAGEAGFKNVKSLYKFLRMHFDTTLTSMRKSAKNSL